MAASGSNTDAALASAVFHKACRWFATPAWSRLSAAPGDWKWASTEISTLRLSSLWRRA
ncbi:hypothetical protein D9M72_261070 [compost metagenome]